MLMGRTRMGAWIETERLQESHGRRTSRTRMGAWIETSVATTMNIYARRTRMGAWIETWGPQKT